MVEVISGGWKLVEVGRDGCIMYRDMCYGLKIAHREINFLNGEM